jgi:hypothetical protein
MPDVSGIAQTIRDPLGAVMHLLVGVLAHVIATAHQDLSPVLQRFLFSTVDPSVAHVRPLTANPGIANLNLGLGRAADVLVGAVMLYVSLRAVFEHSVHARYGLKAALPRVLVAVALVHGSIFLIQMAVDLNNAIGSVAMSLGGPLAVDTLPWSASIGDPSVAGIQATQDVFQALFGLALVVALVILALSYVVRTALLEILIVLAPLAAICMVLPETRRYSHTWLHLFLATLFMQAVQLIILRVATTTAFEHGTGIVGTIYALATLWIMLKVPSVLHSSGYVETRARMFGRHVQRSVRHVAAPAHRVVHRRAPL